MMNWLENHGHAVFLTVCLTMAVGAPLYAMWPSAPQWKSVCTKYLEGRTCIEVNRICVYDERYTGSKTTCPELE